MCSVYEYSKLFLHKKADQRIRDIIHRLLTHRWFLWTDNIITIQILLFPFTANPKQAMLINPSRRMNFFHVFVDCSVLLCGFHGALSCCFFLEKCLLTHGPRKWLFVLVNFPVTSNITLDGKSPLTNPTGILMLFCMYILVSCQITVGVEWLQAYRARKCFFSTVYSLVPFKMGFLSKCFLTNETGKWFFFCVYPEVTFKFLSSWKWLLTNRAWKWFFSCVNLFMFFYWPLLCKCFVANITRKWLLFSVGSFVLHKATFLCKWHETKITWKWFSSFVNIFYVSVKMSFLWKWLLTNVTGKWFLSCVYSFVSFHISCNLSTIFTFLWHFLPDLRPAYI